MSLGLLATPSSLGPCSPDTSWPGPSSSDPCPSGPCSSSPYSSAICLSSRTACAQRSSARGFTLIEVLVALGIVALALMTGLKATQSLVFSAQRQADLLWAQVCADNALNTLRLSRQLPGMGDTSIDCVQARQPLRVQLSVRPTPNPAFRRVDAQVWSLNTPLLRVTTVLGQQ